MPIVIAKKNESFEKLMRRFKRAVEKDGLLNVLREREYYEKPSVKQKRAKAAARKRWERRQEELAPVKMHNSSKKTGRKSRRKAAMQQQRQETVEE